MTPDALKAKVYMGRIPTVVLDKKLRFDRLELDRIIEESKRIANGTQANKTRARINLSAKRALVVRLLRRWNEAARILPNRQP